MHLAEASVLLSLSALVAASPAPLALTTCAPTLKTGVTTTTINGGKAPATTTVGGSTFADGVYINCNLYTSATGITTYTGTPTATVTDPNAAPTTAHFICNPTAVCPTTTPTCTTPTFHPGTLTSTVTRRGNGVSTVYASSVGDGVFVNCSGYTAISVKTAYEPLNHQTVDNPGEVTFAVYECQPTPHCSATAIPRI